MNFNSANDTITSLSTPKGKSGIAVIRISGKESYSITCKLCESQGIFKKAPTRQLFLTNIINETNELIDQVLMAKFIAPHSYTGEDVVEIFCHGGPYVIQEILRLIVNKGARLSEPGEFTQKAFLNGKIDLLQAEAISDLIEAQTKSSLRQSAAQFSGRLSQKINSIKETLKNQCALLELELDFSDEQIELTSKQELTIQIGQIVTDVDTLIRSFEYGSLIRDGVHTIIIGRPNVGKSSILNQLLQQNRAIVTDIPGTTRDSIEESIEINGILVKITDTAGLRETEHPIEKIGVERTQQLIKLADILLFVLDISNPISEQDIELFNAISMNCLPHQKILVLLNKCDLINKSKYDNLPAIFNKENALAVSALLGTNFDMFKEKFTTMVFNFSDNKEDLVITKLRHREILQKSKEYLIQALKSLDSKYTAEFIALDIRNALNSLAELTGEVTSQDILDHIFSNFCIGK